MIYFHRQIKKDLMEDLVIEKKHVITQLHSAPITYLIY